MSNVWERFEGIADTNEVAEAKAKFTPLEVGVYEMKLEEIAPAESSQGLPMVKGKFRVLATNRVVFYNQNLQNLSNPNMTAVNIAEAERFFSGLTGEDYSFTGMMQFATDIKALPIEGVYKISLNYGKKDIEQKYAKLTVIEIVSKPTVSDEDVPS